MDKYAEANVVLSKFCKGYMELKKDLPIRPSEMAVLNIIVQRSGRFTPLTIAELLDVSKSMITAHISVLERKGYITKEQSKEDRRSFYVVPTEKAVDLVATAGAATRKQLEYMKNELGTDNYERLLGILSEANKILTNKREMSKNGLE